MARSSPRHKRVGGQLIIVLGRWAKKVVDFIKDPSMQGVVTGLSIRTSFKVYLMIFSSYWPIVAADTDADQLWNKVSRYLRNWVNTAIPLEYCQQYINDHLIRHLQMNSKNTSILLDDINAT